jgi:cobalt-zinc-cadmium efflux system outer membrane protein
LVFATACIAAICPAQDRLSLDNAIQRSLDASPRVRAAAAKVAAAKASLLHAKSGFAPQVELGPGVGFTNGNSLLSQRIDIGGIRSAFVTLAAAEVASAEVDLQSASQGRAFEVATAYYDLARAKAEEEAVADSVRLANELAGLVRKQVEAGVAPTVQITRAEIEASRVQQELVRAQGGVSARLATLRILVNSPELSVDGVERLPADLGPRAMDVLTAQALANRAEVAKAKGQIDIARAESMVTKANRKPSLYASLATDFWSLDRDPFQSRNVGLQAFMSFPLFNRRAARAEDARDAAVVKAAEADLDIAEAQIRLELARTSEELAARLKVAQNYRADIIPKTESLLQATRRGYEQGLSTLIDLIDAQRTVRLAQTEYLTALFEAQRADLELRRAAATLAPSQSKENPN